MEMLTEPKKVIFPQSYSPKVVTLNLFQGDCAERDCGYETGMQ